MFLLPFRAIPSRAKCQQIDFIIFLYNKKAVVQRTTAFLAGALGLEPRTNGFGDHYSTN